MQVVISAPYLRLPDAISTVNTINKTMTIQNNGDQFEVDFDELDFQSSINDASLDEPMPQVQEARKNPLKGRRSPSKRRGHNQDFVKESTEALKQLDSQVKQICDDDSLSSRDKTELIKYVSKTAGFPKEANAIVQSLLDHHQEKKYGSQLVVINKDQGGAWFEFEPVNIIENFISKNELNIVGGLSGAAKTTFVSMFLAAILRQDIEPKFLGFKVNRELVKSVYFIGLDGGRNVYSPIFQRAGLVNNQGAIPGFNFIPSESGWSITTASLDKLGEYLKHSPDSIVVVDSLLAATSGTGVDENSPAMAGKILDLKLLCEKYGATPIVLAHQKKDSTQDFTGSDSLRGHSSIPCFAGQIITLNFLDSKSKVNGKSIPDRKSPKRRMYSGYRSLPQHDLLVELDFDNGTVSSHGEFYDALYSLQQQDAFEDAIDSAPAIHALMDKWNASTRQVFDCLMNESAPLDQSQVVELSGLPKGTVSKALKRLTEESFRIMPFVDVIESDRRHYWVTDAIKREVNADY